MPVFIKKSRLKSVILSLLLLASLHASAQNSAPGKMWIVFEHFIGNQKLSLKETPGTTRSGENFNVTLLQYYISNIRLTRTDGSQWVVPQEKSYFLIRQSKPESQRLQLSGVPEGKYTGISFTLGIDSTRNTRDIGERKGVLDIGEEGKDMYWAWNSGYIHFKMEGTYTNAADSSAKAQKFAYHIGLFGGYSKPTLNNIREVTLPFGPQQVTVSKTQNPEIEINADILNIFNGLTPISIQKNPTVMASTFSKTVANNYEKGFFKFSRILQHNNQNNPAGIEAIPVH